MEQGFRYHRERSNHFNKRSVTNSGIFPHIAIEWHIFYLNKCRLLWIFAPKWGISNFSTRNVAESSILWASLQILNIFWIVFSHPFKILLNYSNSREKTMKFDAPHLVSNIYDDRALRDLTHLEPVPKAFFVWSSFQQLTLGSI